VIPVRNVMRRKARTVFAVLQIAVAIAAYVSIVGVTKGLRGQFYRISQVFAFDLIVQPRGVASPLFSSITPDDAEKARAVPGVKAVSLLGIHLILPPGRSQPISMLALEPGSEFMRFFPIVEGRALREGDERQIVIGKLMAEELGLGVGGTLSADERTKYEIVGLFETPVIKDVPFLGGQAIMPLGFYRKLTRRQANIMFCHTDPGRTAKNPDEVREGLTRCTQIAPALDAAFPLMQARTIEAFLDTFKQAELIDSFALAISFLAALVSGIGVTNTMLMSVFDRTREIGLLRAIGWSRLRIITMIETEGAILALAGGLLGLPLGLLLIEASKLLIQLGWLSVTLDLPLYAQAVGFAALIGLVGALYPAWRAAHLEPTEALRYE
jgi:putative ABC transport system permease protein